MSRSRSTLGLAALAATVLSLGSLVAPTATAAPDAARETAPQAAQADRLAGMDPGLVAAMKRDLGLDGGEIRARMALEAGAPVVSATLERRLGSSYAGSWIAAGATRLTVATTDRGEVAAIRRGGARAVVVRHTQAELAADRTALDRRAERAPDGVHSWYVDVESNAVVVTAAKGATAAAEEFAGSADSVRVVTRQAAPRPVADIRGGDEYVINGNTLCSVGFAVTGGFVTAGHCGGVGSPTRGAGIDQGTFAGSSFPGNDYGWVRTNGSWVSQPWVNNYSGGNVVVAGSHDAAIGSSVCRSGRTSSWSCGTLRAATRPSTTPSGRSTACPG